MRLKSALRRGVAAAVIAGIVVSSGIPAYAARWDIADGDITVKAGDAEGKNKVSQGETIDKDDTNTVITGESDKNTVTIDTSKGDVDVTFDDLKIDVSGKKEGDGSGDGPVRESKAAVTVQGDHDATIELDGDNELKSGGYNAGLEKNEHESKGTLTIKDDNDTKGALTAEGGFGGAGIGGGIESTGSNITIRGGTIEAVGGSNAAGIGDGAGRASDDTDDPNPGDLYICGDAEVTAKAGSQMTDAKAPAIGGSYGEVPTENLSDDEHKVTGGRLTRLNADGTVMEGMGYDYTSTPKPQPDDDEDDDDDVPPPVQENAPEPLPGGMVVGGFFASRVTIQRLDPALVIDSAADARADLTPGGVVLIESAAPRSSVTTDIPSLREDGVEDIFFRYEDTMTYYSVEKMADAAGEDADVELKQNREDISLRLDGETRDDLSERYQEWVPVQTPEPQERLILTHEEVEQKTSEELRREREEARRKLDESLRQETILQIERWADHPGLDEMFGPARAETSSEELRREREEARRKLDESLRQQRTVFQLPSLDEMLFRPWRAETPSDEVDETPKQDKEDISLRPDGETRDDLPESNQEWEVVWLPEPQGRLIFTRPKEVERKTSEELRREHDEARRELEEILKLPPILIELTRPEGKKYIPGPQDVISEHSRVSINWGDLPDMQSELKLWIPEDLEHLISPSKESLSRIDGIA